MKIVTTYVYPPIPIRSMDWSAVDDETYDGEGCPIGHGATEAEAIADLIEQMEMNLRSDECDIRCIVGECTHKVAPPADDIADIPLGSMELDDKERRLRDPGLKSECYRDDW